jgi:hypothetical protein
MESNKLARPRPIGTVSENRPKGPKREPATNRRSRSESLAAFFRAHPLAWVSGLSLAKIAGAYAWRTRVSDLRSAPFNMTIENRQRHVTEPDGRRYIVSEYRFVPAEQPEAA